MGFTHGGGFFPYQLGRLKHGYEVRDEPKVNGAKSPEKYLHQLYFDTIVFMDKQLRFLVELAGAEHVMLGTDYAFDMARIRAGGLCQRRGIGRGPAQTVLSDNACRMFGVAKPQCTSGRALRIPLEQKPHPIRVGLRVLPLRVCGKGRAKLETSR